MRHQVLASVFALPLFLFAFAGCGDSQPPPGCGMGADCAVAPTCFDGIQNGDEAAIDCGGSCMNKCVDGSACRMGSDCAGGVCDKGQCVTSCQDMVRNGGESDVDCGGPRCARCPDDSMCRGSADCESHVCEDGVCQASDCKDNVLNGDETGVDCGGTCPACTTGARCLADKDCVTRICKNNVCVDPNCIDGKKNGNETDLDCGGTCPGCADGKACGAPGDCTSRVCFQNACTAATCKDGVKNGKETDVDCGGGMCAACAPQKGCAGPADCDSGLCVPSGMGSTCAVPACNDKVKNGTESDIDCGGNLCPTCAPPGACAAPSDCSTGVCTSGKCQPAACNDKVKNGTESDVDCGGDCFACGDGKACTGAQECSSGVCSNKLCVQASCVDRVKNGSETDLDCGGSCPPCADGKSCGAGPDCASGICSQGNTCAVPACDDGVKNGKETALDCGGGCAPCAAGSGCLLGGDCASGVCVNARCAAPSCFDGFANGNETDVDCGGPCAGCAPGKACAAGPDCASRLCDVNKQCMTPACDDMVKNGVETDVDCGGPMCSPCAGGRSCLAGADCVDKICANGACAGCIAAGGCPGNDDACGSRSCNVGVCGRNFAMAGTGCNLNGGRVCDGRGACVACVVAADCPGSDNACGTRTCVNHLCGSINAPLGTACNGGDGVKCNGNGACLPSVMVVRVGDGMAALASSATAAFLEERLGDGQQIQPVIALPTVVNGNHAQLTLSGTATSEGGISRSADGHYLVMGGYAANTATAGVTTSASMTVNRVFARIDAARNIDTTTRINAALSGGNLRGATAADGTGMWGSSSTAGVAYIPFGQLAAGTQISAAPTNVRFLHVFGGQLYGSSGSGAFVNVFTIGSGAPQVGGQTCTALPGMPVVAGPSPYSFALFDRDGNVGGLDTLYVSDDRSLPNGGVQKWTFDGVTWTLKVTFTNGLTAGCRGLTGLVTGNNVTLFATTADATSNKLVSVVDDGNNMNPAFTVLATAGANTAFRGVTLTPQ